MAGDDAYQIVQGPLMTLIPGYSRSSPKVG